MERKLTVKVFYRGCDVPHDCEGGFCHFCLAYFMAWEHDPRPETPCRR